MEVRGVFVEGHVAASKDPLNPKLKAAAHEFEASMMKEFLKPLEHDSLFTEEKRGESDTDEGSDSALMSFGSEAMATAISERGGFGIASMILNHFEAHPDKTHTGESPSPADSHARGFQITKVIGRDRR